ncbi:MAG: 3D domain-containing protein [Thermoanaerobaculia bacterium]
MTARRFTSFLFLTLILTLPVLADAPKKLGRAIVTFYWLIDESSPRYHGKSSATLRDMHGNVIAHTTPRFKKELVMEGTGWLRDGRTVMYEAKVDGENRFRITKSRYGLGSTGCNLDPYRTVAVDHRFVKLGSTIYVPQLKGSKLPDGTIHDGMFVANDHGRFRGAHIDFFVGAGPRGSRPFARKGYGSRSHVTVYLTDEQSANCH